MAQKNKRYRQGDVVLTEVASLPRAANPLSGGVLAVGEATGHSHRFADGGSFARWEKYGRRFVEVLQSSTLVHEEHRPLTIPPGIYEQLAEQEFDYTQVKKETEYRLPNASVRKVRD
jgi:hypothetical protein